MTTNRIRPKLRNICEKEKRWREKRVSTSMEGGFLSCPSTTPTSELGGRM